MYCQLPALCLPRWIHERWQHSVFNRGSLLAPRSPPRPVKFMPMRSEAHLTWVGPADRTGVEFPTSRDYSTGAPCALHMFPEMNDYDIEKRPLHNSVKMTLMNDSNNRNFSKLQKNQCQIVIKIRSHWKSLTNGNIRFTKKWFNMLIFLANGLLTYYILSQIVTNNKGGRHAVPREMRSLFNWAGVQFV